MNRSTRGTRVRSLALAAAALLLTAAPTLGAIKIGTDQGETLTGTNGNDQLTGKGGDDVLKGLAGNDTYYFKGDFGNDTLAEKASYKVRGRKLPGGKDTLSFAGVSNSFLEVYLMPERATSTPFLNSAHGYPNGGGPSSNVDLGTSVVENIVGGSGNSFTRVEAGGQANTYHTGGGGTTATGVQDFFFDRGGFRPPAGDPTPPSPASSDTYQGIAATTGIVQVTDFGGDGDVLDLRPVSSGEVYLDAVDMDQAGKGTKETLQVILDPDTSVYVFGHFGDYNGYAAANFRGRIEQILFADGPINGGGSAASLAASVAQASAPGRAGRTELKAAAERSLAALRRDLAKHPPPSADALAAKSGSADAARSDVDRPPRTDRDGARHDRSRAKDEEGGGRQEGVQDQKRQFNGHPHPDAKRPEPRR